MNFLSHILLIFFILPYCIHMQRVKNGNLRGLKYGNFRGVKNGNFQRVKNRRNANSDALKIIYATAGHDSTNGYYAHAGFVKQRESNSKIDVAYANAVALKGSTFFEGDTGFIHVKAGDVVKIEHNVLTLSGQIKKDSVMIRPTAADVTLHVGPVNVGYGFAIDTGFVVDKGVEIKVFGSGVKVGKDGIQLCALVKFACFGISW